MNAGTPLPFHELGIAPGQQWRGTISVALAPYMQGGSAYAAVPPDVGMIIDVDAMDRGFAFRLRFACDLTGPCSRCLEPASVHIEIDSREVHDESAGDPELLSDFVDGGELHIDTWAQDAVGLEFPVRVLCREDCRGLCPNCGTNWNLGECDCEVVTRDPRWEALKGISFDGD